LRTHIDITDLLEFLCTADVLHGVQNVTHRLIMALGQRAGTRLIGFHPIYGRPFSLDPARLCEDAVADIRRLKSVFGLDGRHPVKSVSAIRHRHPAKPARRSFEYVKRAWRRLRALRPPAPPLALHRNAAGFGITPGDVVIVPGLNIWYPEYNRELGAHVRATGGRLVVVVHDFGPLTASEYFPESYRAAFRDWMRSLLPYADLFVADSEYTRRELDALDPALRGSAPCLVNPLAHEFPRAGDDRPRPEVRELLGTDYVLHVGRIEPRKNIAGLVTVWGRLAAELGPATPALVLVGRMNDPTGALEAAVETAGARQVSFLADLSAAELAHLYAGCRFAVYPSFFEGWGLPVGEAACFGKVTAASNAASICEVVGDLAVYFDPHDLDDMAAVLRRLITDRDFVAGLEARIKSRFHPRSWADCAAGLIAAANIAE
jgi:glycosyltransferase involved in cell wall biosynthesis